jgi:hypothetical protein
MTNFKALALLALTALLPACSSTSEISRDDIKQSWTNLYAVEANDEKAIASIADPVKREQVWFQYIAYRDARRTALYNHNEQMIKLESDMRGAVIEGYMNGLQQMGRSYINRTTIVTPVSY